MRWLDLDTFTVAYVECGLWCSYVEDGMAHLDEDFDLCDLAEETLRKVAEDCKDFQDGNAEDLEGEDLERAGHDFWLTRNRHGAGFWDTHSGPKGRRLTEASHPYGACNFYAGEDGFIYLD